jgi:branched-chain amino acid transport system substrate-binding protein
MIQGRNKLKLRLLAVLLSALLLNLAACGKKEAAPSADGVVVKIGAIQPLTGPQAHLGKDNENGTRMAIDDANAQNLTIGGKKVRFELISEDDQADPKTATIVAQKMVDEKANGIIGHLNSGTTIPASKIYSDAGIVQISPSATNPKYTEQGFRTAFRVMPNDVQQGKVLGDFAVTRLGARKVAIIDDRTAYGQGLADQFEKAAKAAGGEIVAREFTTDKSTDFMAILTAVKAKNPDVLFFGGMDAQGGPMIKQFKTLGLNAKFLMGDGGSTPEFIKLAGGSAEGAYSSLPGLPLDKMPGGKAFADKFTAKYGQIQLYAPYCYDAVSVMIAAMQKADSTDPAKYLPALAGIAHDGVTAKVSFDAKGDIKDGAITLYQVKDGKWEVLETVGGAVPTR